MSTSFGTGPTRDVQAGDTPDLNDGLLSRAQAAQNIQRGMACFLQNGNITIATVANADIGHSAFVPIETVDNSSGVPGDTEMSGVTASQRVALAVITTNILHPGDHVKISDTAVDGFTGLVTKWLNADADNLKYARYLGKEAALLDVNTATPFDETLTVGIVPDQDIETSEPDGTVGWFQLMEAQGGAIT